MSRAGEPRPGWLPPLLVLIVAFCAGAQLAFAFQALLLGEDYFRDALLMKFGTLALLVAGGILLLPPDRRAAWSRAPAAPLAPARPAPAPAAPARAPPAPATAPRTAREDPFPPLSIALETPLAKGPVWPPGEPLPVSVHVRGGPPGHEGVDIELEVQHAGGAERGRVSLKGTSALLSQTIPQPGPFTLTAKALLHGTAVASASVEGRAASYREEIARRFEGLRASATAKGLSVGPDATPRELRDALARRHPSMRRSLEEVVASVEVALYAEDEVGRETYESLVRALADVERRGLEAARHA